MRTDNHVAANSSQRAVLTPYLIPPTLQGRKVMNLGDGFILRAIERLVGQFEPTHVFSSRVAPTEEAIKALEQCPAVILAGANQLTDSYTIWPGLTAEQILKGGLRLIPFGIGLHGAPDRNEKLSKETCAILEAVHTRIEYSSWRCPRTVAVLRRELPSLAARFLMTGCPVLYDRPLLDSTRFCQSEATVAVTATERHSFWEQETRVIDLVAKRFAKSRRFFVTHQNTSPPKLFEPIRHRFTRRDPRDVPDRVEALRLYARNRGFQIVIPRDVDACIQFYEEVDLHIGSRLHAHLLFLSRNKRSFLIPIDGRSLGIIEHLGFPAGPPEELDRLWDFDFEEVRNRARESFSVMEQFIKTLS